MNEDASNQAESADMPDWFEELEHTADAGIVVWGDDLKELFARAAWGMFSVIADLRKVEPAQATRLVLDAPDRQALMVAWLSELNYRHITRHQLFCQFQVAQLSEQGLIGDAQGERIDPGRHVIFTEIKAVTFHNLRIEQANGRWKAQIIFDL